MNSDTTGHHPLGADDSPGTMSAGPFAEPPLGLWDLVSTGEDGEFVPGDDMRGLSGDWLASVLADAGVELGAYDVEVVRVIAEDSVSAVHVVAGWIARTRLAEHAG